VSARWVQVDPLHWEDERWECEIASSDSRYFCSISLVVLGHAGGYLWEARLTTNRGREVCLSGTFWTSDLTRAQEDAENWVRQFGLCLSSSLGGDQ
jgi:hypothetical protein